MNASSNYGVLHRVDSLVEFFRRPTISLSLIILGIVVSILGIFRILPDILILSLASLASAGFLFGILLDLYKIPFLEKSSSLLPFEISWTTRSVGILAGLLVIAVSGGFYSPLHAFLYFCAVVCYPGTSRKAFFFLCSLLMIGEFSLLWEAKQFVQIPFSLTLIACLCALPWLLSRNQEQFWKKEHQKTFEKAFSEVYQEAASYRLRPTLEGLLESHQVSDKSELVRMQGSLLVIKQTQDWVLKILHQSLKLHSAILFWLDDSRKMVFVKTYITESDIALEPEFPAELGAFGSLLKNKSTFKLSSPKSSYLPYYRKKQFPDNIGSWMGIPILLSNGTVVGILSLDRLNSANREADYFSDEEQLLGEQAALQLLSSLQSERLFVAAERSRDAQERLYQASVELNRALTLDQVHETTFSSLRQICPFDFAAITKYDATSKQHQIVAVQGEKSLATSEALLPGFSFPENTSLVSMVIKNQSCLPELNVFYKAEVPLFDPKIRLRNLPSILVLPLLRGESPTGTLVIGSQRTQQFGKLQRELLGIIANQVAVAIENAVCYQSMEAMATIDGLTQLLNRRTWQERFTEMLERAERHQQPVTLLLTDIDYFKKINDTYGHLVGDQVLKQVASVIQACVRKVDLAARYGGEEFAVVLDRAEGTQAFQLAERIRQEIELLEFPHEQGAFRCTLSIGLATFPYDGHSLTALAAHADQALYRAKHQGRNQTIPYASLQNFSSQSLSSKTDSEFSNQPSQSRSSSEVML